ncbi:hypothetical protein IWQ61_009706 [Dispira simplex]|nr:hypothetical protein IWQ61_009706 [Dispira simplex]
MSSERTYPSAARSTNTYSAQCQGLTLKEADDQRAKEINVDVARRMIPNQSDLVEKVTGVSSIGEYSRIAEDFEALGEVVNPDPNSLHQRLYRKASEWFNPVGRSEGGNREARMYPQFKAFVYLIALLVWDKRQELNLPLERYLLPHRMSDIRGDQNSRKRHDIAICWYDPGTDIEEECIAFLEYEEPTSNRKQLIPSTSQTRGKPKPAPGKTKKRSSKGKQPEESPSEPEPEPESEVDVTQGPFRRCFGVVECKADYSKAQEQAEYGQLGWYACSALEAAFERNTMWGWVVSKTIVRFVLFTHGAAVSSEAIDMKDKSGHQMFIDNFIRLCLCSAYRAGFDPTKRWLEDVKVWEVKCFHSAQKPRHKTFAYVKPLPLKIHGSLFGRRTRCHRASLTKDAKKYELVLKESWTELDHDLNNRKAINTEALPNEVRIFEEIRRKRKKSIAKGVPTMKVGGSVYINVGVAPGSEHFSTVEKYCGELDIVNRKHTVQPQTSTTTESGAGNGIPDIKVVNRVQQRILISPMGESMTALYTWAHNPKYIVKFGKADGSELLVVYVVYFFSRLFWVIYNLYEDCNVYHRDLSEGNVLVCECDGDPYPLLIDFDHGRLRSDSGNDHMWSCTGTVPFMSILNLAGYSSKLSIVDELESFLYLWVWKCTIGFAPSDITRPRITAMGPNSSQVTSVQPSVHPRVQPVSRWKLTNQSPAVLARRSIHPVDQAKQPSIRSWAQGEPGNDCLLAKFWHTLSDIAFVAVLDELRPEFRMLKPLFLKLRRILFDWDGKQSSFFLGTESRRMTKVRQGGSPLDQSACGPIETSTNAKPKTDHQASITSTSTNRTGIVSYCDRLISRAEEADNILDKFAIAIEDFFNDYIRVSESDE